MKTNKERVEEVFRRAEASNMNSSDENVTERKSSPMKPWVKLHARSPRSFWSAQ